MDGGGVFCGLSLHYDSTVRLLIVSNIVIVTSDFINNDSDQYIILSLIYLYWLCLKLISEIKMIILLLIYRIKNYIILSFYWLIITISYW